jgi:tripartite-type tricarboxylate transporter receptor subunit TctC
MSASVVIAAAIAAVSLFAVAPDALHAETVKALASPDVKEFMTKDGAEAVGSTPEELRTFFRSEVAKYAEIIATANVRAD